MCVFGTFHIYANSTQICYLCSCYFFVTFRELGTDRAKYGSRSLFQVGTGLNCRPLTYRLSLMLLKLEFGLDCDGQHGF